MQQIYSTTSKIDVNFGLPDLSSALRQIQSQYDSIAAKNLQVWCKDEVTSCSSFEPHEGAVTKFISLQEMDTWYRTKFQDLSNASNKHVQSVRSVREELAGYKKDVSYNFHSC